MNFSRRNTAPNARSNRLRLTACPLNSLLRSSYTLHKSRSNRSSRARLRPGLVLPDGPGPPAPDSRRPPALALIARLRPASGPWPSSLAPLARPRVPVPWGPRRIPPAASLGPVHGRPFVAYSLSPAPGLGALGRPPVMHGGAPYSGPVMHGGGGLPWRRPWGRPVTGGPWPWVISKNYFGPVPGLGPGAALRRRNHTRAAALGGLRRPQLQRRRRQRS